VVDLHSPQGLLALCLPVEVEDAAQKHTGLQ
jgi:hypothetical protein